MTSSTVTYNKINLDEITTYQIDQVAFLVVKLAEELKLPLDRDVIYGKVESCINNQIGELYCMFDGDVIVGMMGLVYAAELWNDKICATEIAWYVLPKYRGRAGIYLIKEVEKNIKAGRIRIGVGDIRLVKMLQRMGWTHTKYIVEKEVDHGRTNHISGRGAVSR